MEACQPTLNNPTTEQNVPEQKWSCYGCLYKFGLFALVLLKMALNFWLLLLLFLGLCLVIDVPKAVFCLVLLCIASFIDVFDIFMGLVIIISICLKYERMLEMYYRYSIYVFGSLTVLCCIIMYTIIPIMSPVLTLLLKLILVLLLQVYLNYLVKSEVMKLKENAQIQL